MYKKFFAFNFLILNSYTAKRIFLAYSSINVHTYIDSPQSESRSFITSIKFLVLPTVVTLYHQPENLALLSSSLLPWFPLLRLLYKWNDPVCNLLRVLVSHSILLWDSSKLWVITIGPSLWCWVSIPLHGYTTLSTHYPLVDFWAVSNFRLLWIQLL